MRDILLGVRSFRRTPGVAAAAVISMALGIGAATAIFAVVRHVLLAPLPHADADRLVMLWETAPDNPARWVAPANYLDWQRELGPVVSSMAAFDSVSLTWTGDGDAERLRGVSVAGTFFPTLRQGAAEGRTLTPDDDRPGAPCVAVLSAGLRARRFSDSPIVGRPLTLDGRVCTVVGVLPAAFRFALQPRAEVWINGDRGVPRSYPFPGDVTAVRDAHLLYVLGRLADGVAPETAAARLATVAAGLAREFPATNAGLGARLMPLHEAVVGSVARQLWLLQGAVAVLLVVATANVAHLLLGRGAGRRQDLTVRVSLGATERDLARQLCGEALAIALPGGALGVLLAALGLDLLEAAAPPGLPRLDGLGLDGVVLAVAIGVTLLTAIAAALMPLLSGGTRPAGHTSGVRVAGSGRLHRWHRGLVVGELALAQVVVVGAWLIAASLLAASRVDLGYATSGRVAAELTLSALPAAAAGATADSSTAPASRLVERVLEDLRRDPTVRRAAAALTAPLSGAPNRGVSIVGEPAPPPGQERDADFQVVTPGYFETLGIRLDAGRDFAATDDRRAPPVAIVNAETARRHFGGASPLGRDLIFGRHRHTIIGVVGDTRYRRVETAPHPTFYVPLAQNTDPWPFLAFVVWSDSAPGPSAAALREAVRRAAPEQPLTSLRSVDDAVGEALAARRFNARLFGLLAATTLTLAVVGAYGVTAALAAARRREFAIRAALGASGRRLQAQIVGETAALGLVATVLGQAGAWALGRALERLLFEVSATDVRVLGLGAVTVCATAIAAAWPAAHRVGRTMPVEALDAEA